jgi:hypothetical protein
MGQYFAAYNIDKRESIGTSATFDNDYRFHATKMMEHLYAGGFNSMSNALLLLVSCGNGEGLGDAMDVTGTAGRWAGDRIVVQGDYATSSHKGWVDAAELSTYEDITGQVITALAVLYNDDKRGA